MEEAVRKVPDAGLKWPRTVRIAFRRRLRTLGLTQRFLIVALAIIAAAIALLGSIISEAVRYGVTEGVAQTAAAGFDSLVANSVGPAFADEILTEEEGARLATLFEIGSDAQTTRLIQLRIFRPNGQMLYEATDGIVDTEHRARIAQALDNRVSMDVVDLPMMPIGPLGTHPITVLRLYTPLHESGTDRVIGVAALYYSARSLLDIQAQTQTAVWTAVLLIGAATVGSLIVFVWSADRASARQSRRLATNLEYSRQLSEQVRGLHKASEQLRIDAIDANEQLLARVGSDIHDGPLQLMTLAILQLTKSAKDPTSATNALKPTVVLTTEAMTELRNISVGLVLPELEGLTLEDTLKLAIARHEGVTGSTVASEIVDLDHRVEQDVQICLYRVVQESLSNAYRHSGGRDQAISASHADGSIFIEVTNSSGTPAAKDNEIRPKLGLRGMRLRLEAVGGTMTVEMRQDRTIVRVLVPSAAKPNAAR
jgi:signal transduction histidine kinase